MYTNVNGKCYSFITLSILIYDASFFTILFIMSLCWKLYAGCHVWIYLTNVIMHHSSVCISWFFFYVSWAKQISPVITDATFSMSGVCLYNQHEYGNYLSIHDFYIFHVFSLYCWFFHAFLSKKSKKLVVMYNNNKKQFLKQFLVIQRCYHLNRQKNIEI